MAIKNQIEGPNNSPPATGLGRTTNDQGKSNLEAHSHPRLQEMDKLESHS